MSPADELVDAAERLLQFGGSVTRREALREALKRLPYAPPERQDITRQWPFTSPALGVIARAADIAKSDGDSHVRIKHIEQALKDALR